MRGLPLRLVVVLVHNKPSCAEACADADFKLAFSAASYQIHQPKAILSQGSHVDNARILGPPLVIRKEWGTKVRPILRAGPGNCWHRCDLSQERAPERHSEVTPESYRTAKQGYARLGYARLV